MEIIKAVTRKGFTLIELLIVIAVLATISTLTIVLLSGVETQSAEAVNISNIKKLTDNIGSYYLMHNKTLPNKLDSLFTSAASTANTETTGGTYITTSTDVAKLLYHGTDVDGDGAYDTGVYFKGLHEHNTTSFSLSLIAGTLTASDVANLKKIGITTVYDINDTKDAFHGSPTYVERTLAAGGYVALVNPTPSRSGLYGDLGIDLSDTTTYPRVGGTGTTANDLTDAARTTALTKKRFFVFGLGPKASWIGDQVAGIQESPKCKVVEDGVYDNYFVVIAMPAGANDTTLPYAAGIIDSMGKSARGATSWSTRTYGR